MAGLIDLRERVKWAIDYVKRENKLSDEKVGEKTGVIYGTINNYRNMKTTPGIDFIARFCTEFGFNERWLLYGENEPFPGAREKYPEICGPRFYNASHVEGSSSDEMVPKGYKEGEDEMRGTRLSDDIALAARILESRTPYATALRLNIQAFGRAMSAEQRISQVEQRVTTSESQLLEKLNELTSRIRELELRNEELESATHQPPKSTETSEGDGPETK